MNLSGAAGLSPVRDTSSCEFSIPSFFCWTLVLDVMRGCELDLINCCLTIDYSGPRRGQRRFRYTDYEDGYEDEF